MDTSPERKHLRAIIAEGTRRLGSNHPKVIAAKRDLCAVKLAEHAEAAVAGFAPLSDEQVHRIVALLKAGAA